jgi:hypothetical protein
MMGVMMTSERSFAADKRLRECAIVFIVAGQARKLVAPETHPSGTGGRSDLCGDRSDKTVDL